VRTYNLFYRQAGDFERLVETKEIEDSENILIQVFTGITDTNHIREVQKEVKRCFSKAVLIGTTTGGEIYNGNVFEGSTVISVSVFERSRVKLALSEEKTSALMAEKLAQTLSERESKLTIVFADGLNSNGDDIVSAFNRICPNVPLVGGLAGDGFSFKGTFTFTTDEILPHGGVGVAILSKELYITKHYNLAWIPIGKEMKVTRAEGNRLYEIEGKSAVEIYKEYLGSAAQELLPHIAIEFPLVFERDGILIARACLGIDKDGAMIYEGAFKPGEKVRFSIWDTGIMLESTAQALKKFRSSPSETIFVYTCAARKYLMGREVEVETKHLQNIAPTSGFLTYGEFYNFGNKNGFLNYTLTAVSLSENRESRAVLTEELGEEKNREPIRFRALVSLVNSITQELVRANRELKQLAERDPLTGLYNRRKIVELLEEEISRAERYARPFSLILADVDNFKSINDMYGHQTGDEVLKEIAHLLQRELREADALARWGGEEFIVLMRETNLTEGMFVGQKIKNAIRDHFQDKYDERISLSIGVTSFREGDTVNSIIRRADMAMYFAKQRGKDTVMSY